jgi:tetratricopeptide (TPR) repeat protein
LLERALSIVEKALGPEHTDLTSTLGSLASLYRKRGEPEKALGLLDRALAINENAFGPDHPNIADIEEDRAALFVMAGDNVQAHLCLERALAIYEQAFGPEHTKVAGIEEDRGVLFLNDGDHEKARLCFHRVLAIQEQANGPDSPAALLAIYNLACVSAMEGKKKEALQHLQLAVERGFDGAFMADDTDLASLHGDPEFETLVARVTERNGRN